MLIFYSFNEVRAVLIIRWQPRLCVCILPMSYTAEERYSWRHEIWSCPQRVFLIALKNRRKKRGALEMAKTKVDRKALLKRNMGYSAVFIVVVLLLVAALLWGKQSVVVACKAKDIMMAPGEKSGAAGTVYQNIDFKNKGKATCTLSGFPTAFLYGDNGYAVGNGAVARPNPDPVVVTLKPDQTAHTTLGYPQPGNFDPGICSGPSSTLRLYIPGETTPSQVSLTESWCPGFSVVAMQPGE